MALKDEGCQAKRRSQVLAEKIRSMGVIFTSHKKHLCLFYPNKQKALRHEGTWLRRRVNLNVMNFNFGSTGAELSST